jgi:FkbM family methyltransferase
MRTKLNAKPAISVKHSDEFNRNHWFGLKNKFKQLLAWRPINRLIIVLLRPMSDSISWISRLPVNIAQVTVKSDAGEFTMNNPMRCSIAKAIHWGDGLWDFRDRVGLDLFCLLSAKTNFILDVGANTGLYSLAAAQVNKGATIRAYEIVPDVFDLLNENVRDNRCYHSIHCELKGIGTPDTTILVPSMAEFSALPSSISIYSEYQQGAEIEIVALDSIEIPDFVDGRFLIKIDVEGAEYEVLENGTDMLKNFSPDIICEILNSSKNVDSISDLLRDFGYKLFLIKGRSLIQYSSVVPDPYWRDWFFTTRPLSSLPSDYEQLTLKEF